jgi:4,5-DOPA dioxygenase extradiol
MADITEHEPKKDSSMNDAINSDKIPSYKTPVLFVSHGSPLLAIDSQAGEIFNQWGRSLSKPRALLVFSAHWEAQQLMFGESGEHRDLIYDFSGFPAELYELQYPAPGAPWLIDVIETLLSPQTPLSRTDRGLDHGVWVPLLRMWPQADIPILQMSLPHTLSHEPISNQALFDLGKRLAPLREQGIMIICTGVITHNLREAFTKIHTEPPLWATSFDQWVTQTLKQDRRQLVKWEQAPYARQNHPTPEHFLPLLISAGAADDNDDIRFPVTGFEMNLFSRTSVQFG